jgi:predicted dehydrogenase
MPTRDRRDFLKASLSTVAAAAWTANPRGQSGAQATPAALGPARIRFAAIGMNHGHINGQVETVKRGGGQLVSFFAKEPELAATFAKRFPEAKLVRSEREILEDPTLQLVVSAAVPNERAPLGIEVMQHGKDFMVDKPAATTLEQVADVRRVGDGVGA